MIGELLGSGLALPAVFVGFGVLIGILFGFFGMGGSFLVTPALLVMGYPSRVAVGSGLAFVFGTAVIATLKHRDMGQVDYKLGVSMIVGTTIGLEIGKELVVYLEEMGIAGVVIGVTYVGLLGGIGIFVTREAMKGGGGASLGHDAAETDGGEDDIPAVAQKIQSYNLPPMLNLRGGIQVSLWLILAVAFATGLLSGFLGVGGGFIRMPALFYLLGVPVPIAVGTDLFEIVFSGGIGSLLYAQLGAVNLSIVVPLLAGSALGARIGSASTNLVDEDEIKIYFGVMLIGGAFAVAIQELGKAFEIAIAQPISLVLILGAALLVAGAVVVSSVRALQTETTTSAAAAD
jgi:uncharacterized membrane protein YfcA